MPLPKKNLSSFQKLLLKIICKKLHLMCSEICQLNGKIDFSDKDSLIQEILAKIATGEIISAHVSKKEAKNFLTFLEDLDAKQKTYYSSEETNLCQPWEKSNKNFPF